VRVIRTDLDYPVIVAGNVHELVDNVWRWTVAKDHIQSDLIVMIALLERCQGRANAKLRLSIPCCGTMYVEAFQFHREAG
jgi:hypothetical protein